MQTVTFIVKTSPVNTEYEKNRRPTVGVKAVMTSPVKDNREPHIATVRHPHHSMRGPASSDATLMTLT